MNNQPHILIMTPNTLGIFYILHLFVFQVNQSEKTDRRANRKHHINIWRLYIFRKPADNLYTYDGFLKAYAINMVSKLPLISAGACFATSVENMDESATTVNPQINKNVANKITDCPKTITGERRQQIQEIDKHSRATLFSPKYLAAIPLKTQAHPPEEITRNENRDVFNWAAG